MAKRRMGRYRKAFKQMAVERLSQCKNIVALSQELGVFRRLLYTWREKLEPVESGDGPPATSRESTLRHEVSRLNRVLAEGAGSGFFSKGPCTPSRRDASGGEKLRTGIYAHIRDVMSRQGRLSIERMCDLAQVSRPGFYRSLRAHPSELRRRSMLVSHTVGAAHAGRQPPGGPTTGLRGHDRCAA